MPSIATGTDDALVPNTPTKATLGEALFGGLVKSSDVAARRHVDVDCDESNEEEGSDEEEDEECDDDDGDDEDEIISSAHAASFARRNASWEKRARRVLVDIKEALATASSTSQLRVYERRMALSDAKDVLRAMPRPVTCRVSSLLTTRRAERSGEEGPLPSSSSSSSSLALASSSSIIGDANCDDELLFFATVDAFGGDAAKARAHRALVNRYVHASDQQDGGIGGDGTNQQLVALQRELVIALRQSNALRAAIEALAGRIAALWEQYEYRPTDVLEAQIRGNTDGLAATRDVLMICKNVLLVWEQFDAEVRAASAVAAAGTSAVAAQSSSSHFASTAHLYEEMQRLDDTLAASESANIKCVSTRQRMIGRSITALQQHGALFGGGGGGCGAAVAAGIGSDGLVDDVSSVPSPSSFAQRFRRIPLSSSSSTSAAPSPSVPITIIPHLRSLAARAEVMASLASDALNEKVRRLGAAPSREAALLMASAGAAFVGGGGDGAADGSCRAAMGGWGGDGATHIPSNVGINAASVDGSPVGPQSPAEKFKSDCFARHDQLVTVYVERARELLGAISAFERLSGAPFCPRREEDTFLTQQPSSQSGEGGDVCYSVALQSAVDALLKE